MQLKILLSITDADHDARTFLNHLSFAPSCLSKGMHRREGGLFSSVFNKWTGCPEMDWPPELSDIQRINSPLAIQKEAVSDLLSHLKCSQARGTRWDPY